MNILTFDFEEWYTYLRDSKGARTYWEPILNYYLDSLLDLLDEHHIRATFFCLGIIAKTDPHLIRKIASKGHDIGCHSYNHNFVTDMEPASFQEDTYKAIDLLEQLTGDKIEAYRAPAFSISDKTKWAIEVLIECGIKYDSSIFPANRRYGGFKNFQSGYPTIISINSNEIMEFPINYTSLLFRRLIYSGGGYFRLLPYFAIRRFFETSDYNMVYLHLRDIDAHQKKRLTLSYFTNYYGIKESFSKFKKLLSDFKFSSIKEATQKYDWNSCPVLYL